jgi:SAM-dependent methyltransferase
MDNKLKTIDFETEVVADENNEGVFSFICRDPKLISDARTMFGREGGKLTIKIFQFPLAGKIEEYIWGKEFNDREKKSLLIEAVKAQNLCAIEGIAPRVYALFLIRRKNLLYPALLTEDLGQGRETSREELERVYYKAEKVLKDKGITPPFFDMYAHGINIVGGKWVDFQGAHLTEEYEKQLKDRLSKSATWVGNFYQQADDLGIDGFRKTENRIKTLGIDQIDFNNKNVLDIGCSAGVFCNYAYEHGAKRVVGIDKLEIVTASMEYSNYRGNFNIDYLGMDYADINAPVETEVQKFDVVLYLSVYDYFSYTEKTHRFVKDILIFEQNGKETDEQVLERLHKFFGKIELKSHASDYDNRNIYWCYDPKPL